MKRTIYIALALGMLGIGTCFGKGDKNAVVNCGAEAVGCSAVVNALGDPVMIDMSKLSVKDLGKITADKTTDITLPKTYGTSTAYSYTPSTGEAQGIKTLLVLENVKPKARSRLAGKTLIRAARHFEPVKPGTPWIEVGRFEIDAQEVEYPNIPVTIKPNGFVVFSPSEELAKHLKLREFDVKKMPMVFPVTKKDLGQLTASPAVTTTAAAAA